MLLNQLRTFKFCGWVKFSWFPNSCVWVRWRRFSWEEIVRRTYRPQQIPNSRHSSFKWDSRTGLNIFTPASGQSANGQVKWGEQLSSKCFCRSTYVYVCVSSLHLCVSSIESITFPIRRPRACVTSFSEWHLAFRHSFWSLVHKLQ